jgi:hypothetical protein
MTYAFHHGFRRDLDDFSRAAANTPGDDHRAWRALLLRWDLFGIMLEYHHNNEDLLVWPLLRERCAEAGDPDSSILDRTEAEHDAIDALLPSVRDAIAACASGRTPAESGVRELLEEARVVISGHLAHEERDALRVLQRYLSAAEWDELQGQFRKGLRLAVLLQMAPWLMKGLPLPVAARIRGAGGPGLRLVLRLGSRPFRRLDRLAFEYAP